MSTLNSGQGCPLEAYEVIKNPIIAHFLATPELTKDDIRLQTISIPWKARLFHEEFYALWMV